MTKTILTRRLCGPLACAVALMAAACGGHGDATGRAQAQVVVLDTERFDSIDALADAAASERGAPGEGETVLYLLRSRGGTPATAQAEQLRTLGFRHVETE